MSLISMLSVSVVFSGCQKGDEEVNPDIPEGNEVLISSELIGRYSVNQVNQRFQSFSRLFTKYDIKVYKLIYATSDESGNRINASGAIMVPDSRGESWSVLSLQHGTITNDRSAPSYYNSGSEAYYSGTLLASNGYIVSAPDYIGYGASNHLPHLYEHAATLGSASLDMLRATVEFCRKEGIELNKQTFLAGYSEGGYATMALHKLIEEKYPEEFNITASAPGAGAYDKTSFARYIMNQKTQLSFMNNYLWVLDTYNKVYKLNHSWSHYLNEPYASAVSKHGIFTGVNGNPQKLFAESFKEAVKHDTDIKFFKALADNDIYDWEPKAPLTLFHGTDDDFVPVFNSVNAYNAMRARGASHVNFHPLEGKNHSSAILDYSLGVIVWFNNFRASS